MLLAVGVNKSPGKLLIGPCVALLCICKCRAWDRQASLHIAFAAKSTQPLWLLLTQHCVVLCEQCSVRSNHAHNKHANSYLGMRIGIGILGVRCWQAWRWRWRWWWGCMGGCCSHLLDHPETKRKAWASSNGDARSRNRQLGNNQPSIRSLQHHQM